MDSGYPSAPGCWLLTFDICDVFQNLDRMEMNVGPKVGIQRHDFIIPYELWTQTVSRRARDPRNATTCFFVIHLSILELITY